MDAPFLCIDSLAKRYDDFTALHGIDLDVAEGEFLTIVGPSGSGKTTLVKLLVGMEEQSEGTISLRGSRIDTLPAHRRPTCMVFQSLALFPHRSVGENIEFPLKIRGTAAAERRARADELLDLFRLPRSFHGKRISECSGGEKQRIALARAFAFDPEILFFDEPLSALDFRLRKTLEKELKALHAATGKTFVYITHSLEEAMVMSDRIAILRAGRFEQIGPAAEIYSEPKSRFVAEFMGDVNLFDIARGDEQPTGSLDGLTLQPGVHERLVAGREDAGTLMVRPERMRFLKPGEQADFAIEGAVEAEYLLGSRTQVEVRAANGRRLALETSNDVPRHEQAGRVRVGFALEHSHLIDERAP